IDDERLLADGVRAVPERRADVRVVQIVRRADTDVVHAAVFGPAVQLREMADEALVLREEARLERVASEPTHRVVRIEGRHETVVRVVDGLEMPGRDEPGRSGEREVSHVERSFYRFACPPAAHG